MIRKAKLTDFDEILKIFIEVQYLHAKNEPNIFKFADPIDLNSFKVLLNKENCFMLVFEDNRIIKGFINGTIVNIESNLTLPRKLLHIETIAVKKEFQNQKIGHQLISKIKEVAKKTQCDCINLNVWCFNKNARIFYKHLGFEEKSIKMELNLE